MKAKKKKIAKMKPQDLGVDMAPRIEVCIAFSGSFQRELFSFLWPIKVSKKRPFSGLKYQFGFETGI